jgi:hypothetical protein
MGLASPIEQRAGQRFEGLKLEQTELDGARTGVDHENAHQRLPDVL